MSREQLLSAVSCVLMTLADIPDYAPRSSLDLGLQERLGLDFEGCRTIERILTQAGWAETTADTIRITKAGRAKAAAVQKLLEAGR